MITGLRNDLEWAMVEEAVNGASGLA